MDEPKPIKVAGIEMPAGERTTLVDHLLRVVEQQQAEIRALRDEIDRRKGLPRRPTIRPSTLNAPHPDPLPKKKRRGKRPGSAKRQKTGELVIHETIPLALGGLPEGTRQNGYEDVVVQDVNIEAHNVRYRRLRYLLPDGSHRTAPLPPHVQGHFGSGLRSYVLSQHHQNGVTQPLIHEELLDLSIDLSTGQIDRLLTEGHEPFHEEKLLRLPQEEYVWNEDAFIYAKEQGLSLELRARLASATWKGTRMFSSDKAGERQLSAWKIRGDEPRRIVTEAALFGTLMHYDLLLVLERPEIPLHNHLSESAIREWAMRRKISAGTQSALGRRCRDTFISLKKTCRKLGLSFWRYLQDRIRGAHDLLALPDLMRQAAQET